ncbi:MAG: GPW/gp25 family protein [bacterium]
MTILSEIKYVDWQCKLNDIGSVAEGLEDINQCIAIILSTQKGSVPHRPTFGSDILKYVDTPVNIAKPNIIREVIDAINLWETRVNVDSVTVEINETQLNIKVQWSLKEDSSTSGTSEVSV